MTSRLLRLIVQITNLERLVEVLRRRMPNLKYLSLLGNGACPHQMTNPESDEKDYQRYRYTGSVNLSRVPNFDLCL
jgi:hypothetical protein